MIVYDVAMKVLDTESFLQHNISDLISGSTFIVLFSQDQPLRLKETNSHKHTHTHTHTERDREGEREREKETERESSVVSDLITMGYELTDKIRSSLVLT